MIKLKKNITKGLMVNKLPKHLANSSEVEGYQQILDSFTERGEVVHWGKTGPYILSNGYVIDVSHSFMYPTIFKCYNKSHTP